MTVMPSYAQPVYFEKQLARFATNVFGLVRGLLMRAPVQSQVVSSISNVSSAEWLLTALGSPSLVPSSAGAIFSALAATMLNSVDGGATPLRILGRIGEMGVLGKTPLSSLSPFSSSSVLLRSDQQQQNNNNQLQQMMGFNNYMQQQNQQSSSNSTNSNSIGGKGDSMRFLFLQECRVGSFPLTIGFLEFAIASCLSCPDHPAIPATAKFISEEVVPGLFSRAASSTVKDKDEIRMVGALSFTFLSKAADVGPANVGLDDVLSWNRAPLDTLGEAVHCINVGASLASEGAPIGPVHSLLIRSALLLLLSVVHRCHEQDSTAATTRTSGSNHKNQNQQHQQQHAPPAPTQTNRRSFVVDARTSENPEFVSTLLRLLQTGDILIATACINLLCEYTSATACDGARLLQSGDAVEAAAVTSAIARFASVPPLAGSSTDDSSGTSADPEQQKSKQQKSGREQQLVKVTGAATKGSDGAAAASSPSAPAATPITAAAALAAVTVAHPPAKGIIIDKMYSIDPHFYQDCLSRIETLRLRTLEMLSCHAPLAFPSIVSLAFGLPLHSHSPLGAGIGGAGGAAGGGGIGGLAGGLSSAFAYAGSSASQQYQQHHQYAQQQQQQQTHSTLFSAIMDALGDSTRCYSQPEATAAMAKLIQLVRRYHTSTPLLQGELRRRDGTDILDSLHTLSDAKAMEAAAEAAYQEQKRVAGLLAERSSRKSKDGEDEDDDGDDAAALQQKQQQQQHQQHFYASPAMAYLRYAFLITTLARDVLTLRCSTTATSSTLLTYTQNATLRHIRRMVDKPRAPAKISDTKMELWYKRVVDGVSVPSDAKVPVPAGSNIPFEFLQWAWTALNDNLRALPDLPLDVVAALRSSSSSAATSGGGGVGDDANNNNSGHQHVVVVNNNNQQYLHHHGGGLAVDRTTLPPTASFATASGGINTSGGAGGGGGRGEGGNTTTSSTMMMTLVLGSESALPFVADLFHPREKFDLGVPHYEIQAVLEALRARHAATHGVNATIPTEEWKKVIETFVLHNYIAREHSYIVTFLQAWSDVAEVLCWRMAFDGQGLKTMFESLRTVLHLLYHVASSFLTPSSQARAQTDIARALLAFAATLQRMAESNAAATTMSAGGQHQQQHRQKEEQQRAELSHLAVRIVASFARVLDVVADQATIRSNVEAALLLILHSFHTLHITISESVFLRLQGTLITPAVRQFCDALTRRTHAALSSAVVSANLLRWLYQRPSLASAVCSSPMFPDSFVNEVRMPRGQLLHIVETTCGNAMNNLLQSLFSDGAARTYGGAGNAENAAAAGSSGNERADGDGAAAAVSSGGNDRGAGNNSDSNNNNNISSSDSSEQSAASSYGIQCLPLYAAEGGLGILSAIATAGCSIELLNSGALEFLCRMSVWNSVEEAVVGFTALESYRNTNSKNVRGANSMQQHGNSNNNTAATPSSSSSAKNLFRFEVAQRVLLSVLQLNTAMLNDAGLDHAKVPVEASGLLKSRQALFTCIFSSSFVGFCEGLIYGEDFQERAALATSVLSEAAHYVAILARCDVIQEHVPFLVRQYRFVKLVRTISETLLRVVSRVGGGGGGSSNNNNNNNSASSASSLTDRSARGRFLASLFETLAHISSVVEIAASRGFQVCDDGERESSAAAGGGGGEGFSCCAGFTMPEDVSDICSVLRALRSLYPRFLLKGPNDNSNTNNNNNTALPSSQQQAQDATTTAVVTTEGSTAAAAGGVPGFPQAPTAASGPHPTPAAVTAGGWKPPGALTPTPLSPPPLPVSSSSAAAAAAVASSKNADVKKQQDGVDKQRDQDGDADTKTSQQQVQPLSINTLQQHRQTDNNQKDTTQPVIPYLGEYALSRNPTAVAYADNAIRHLLVALSNLHAALERAAKKTGEAAGSINNNNNNSNAQRQTKHIAHTTLLDVKVMMAQCADELVQAFPARHAVALPSNFFGGSGGGERSSQFDADAFAVRFRFANGSAAMIPSLLQCISNAVVSAGARRPRALLYPMAN